jgi:hypothetical protein
MQVTLAADNYITTTPRPKLAQNLRGIFAFADDDDEKIADGIFTQAMNSQFIGENLAIEANTNIIADNIYRLIGSMLSELEFETKHMTRPEGALSRGADYAQNWNKISYDEAMELFVNGTALVIRANSQTALEIETLYPNLLGKIAMVPIKLPLLPITKQIINGEEEPTQNEETIMNNIAINNQNFRTIVTGALYIPKNAQNETLVTTFLLKLFCTDDGAEKLSGLGIVPFAPYSVNNSIIHRQITAAANGQNGLELPVQPSEWLRAQNVIGGFIKEELMNKDEWLQAEVNDFFGIATAVVGMRE